MPAGGRTAPRPRAAARPPFDAPRPLARSCRPVPEGPPRPKSSSPRPIARGGGDVPATPRARGPLHARSSTAASRCSAMRRARSTPRASRRGLWPGFAVRRRCRAGSSRRDRRRPDGAEPPVPATAARVPSCASLAAALQRRPAPRRRAAAVTTARRRRTAAAAAASTGVGGNRAGAAAAIFAARFAPRCASLEDRAPRAIKIGGTPKILECDPIRPVCEQSTRRRVATRAVGDARSRPISAAVPRPPATPALPPQRLSAIRTECIVDVGVVAASRRPRRSLTPQTAEVTAGRRASTRCSRPCARPPPRDRDRRRSPMPAAA